MPDGRYIETDLQAQETLTEYGHRRWLARRDREDDHAPICAEPPCPNFATVTGYCAGHQRPVSVD